MILYKQPEVMHYFNPQTAVSIELPFSWTEAEGGVNEAIYVYELDEEEQDSFGFQPQLVIKRFTLPVMPPDADVQFATDLIAASQPEQAVQQQEAITIDGVVGQLVRLSYMDVNAEDRITQLQIFLPVEQQLFSVTGLLAEKDADTFLLDMQTAVNSIRII